MSIASECAERYMSDGTYYSRLKRGWTKDEALNKPKGMPIWAYRFENKEGVKLDEFLRACCEFGITLPEAAVAIGCTHNQLQWYTKKTGFGYKR